MIISGQSSSGFGQNGDYKMKHNSSNQSIHSQKKIGSISTIRKPGAGGGQIVMLDNSFNNQ